ncbi:hypothetical protein BS47DRAFT_1300947 [Hydnum rufescens UP504]|uniref:Prephenate dehydratase domain-containing protein n=1 Tax=Hydnum rufescens UP504 TaxID=1448309 RepID=A0A9P6AS22_9AGAM|nr:hypothetical protein BS47DRAFT_1300947 [Hydnum rufescens UP504]
MSRPTIAYLGPEGTYTHQAAHDVCASDVQYVAKGSIREVFGALDESVTLALVPLENSTYGSVVETYDTFRDPRMGSKVFVRSEHVLAIQHCLIALPGTRMEEITRIISHEQALGQCAEFIRTKLPKAKKVSVASTALAAKSLLDEFDGTHKTSAAICSAVCITVYPGLEILSRSVQDGPANQTRFLLLHTQRLDPLPLTKPLDLYLSALIRVRVEAPPSSKLNLDLSGIFRSLVATPATTLCSLSIRHVNRRPSLNAIPFNDTVFIELEGGHDRPAVALDLWYSAVIAGVERVRHYLQDSGYIEGEVVCIGSW